MSFTLPPLPYAKNALEPVISERTMSFHYDKHHKGYVDKLNKLTANTPWANMQLPAVISKAWGNPSATKIFNNAAQIWNHDFFWHSMSPNGGESKIGSTLQKRIESAFETYDKFESEFVQAAVDHFGSGYAWLVVETDELRIITTEDAVPPTVLGFRPLLACDVWEHAYYLDYQNEREKFVRSFLQKLAHWEFAEEQLKSPPPKSATSPEAGAWRHH